jgi:hypothetical protein
VAVAVRAQPPGVPVIGFLNQEAAELTASNVTGFRKDLSEAGFVENQNVVIEFGGAKPIKPIARSRSGVLLVGVGLRV